MTATMTASSRDTTQPSDPAATAVVVLGEAADLDRSGQALRDLVASIDRSRYYPSVLVPADLHAHAVLDELRLAGVPVMVQRPLGATTGISAWSRRLLELAYWLRSADARIVYVPADDQRLVRAVGLAQRLFARGVGEVIQVTLP